MIPFSATAATITGVSIHSVSSELTVANRLALNVINGSGLNEGTGVHDTNSADGTMWLTNGTIFAPTDPLPASITINLGDIYDLSTLKVWNYLEGGTGQGRGANSVNISVSPTLDIGGLMLLGNFTFLPGTSSGQSIDLSSFTAADNTRLVRFDILSNGGDGNQFVGLSEVRFDGALAVPEPSVTLLGVLAGFGLISRRRR